MQATGDQTLSYTDTGSPFSGICYYVFTALDYAGHESVYSNEVTVNLKLPAPTGVSAKYESTTAYISWDASSNPSVAGYYVYRSTTPGGGYTKLNQTPVQGTTFTNTITIGVNYYYVVTAANSSGNESEYSSEVRVKTRYEETENTTYSSGWNIHTNSNNSGGTAKFSSTTGSYVEFSFTGTGVRWIGYAATSRGIARVIIDSDL